MIFRATIEQSGKTATGIRIPDEVVAALGAGRRPAVRVTIGGHTYHSRVATFEELSYSNKRWHVQSIEGAKTPETRQRRIAKSVSTLREARHR